MPLIKTLGKLLSGSAVWAAVIALSTISSANQAPTANAGENQPGVRINDMNVFLFGEASDDSTPAENLGLLWTQVSGPAAAAIADPTNNYSRITFPRIGTYVIELRASDGTLIGRDSTIITVLDSLPFIILAPHNNAQIQIGRPYVIRWQLEPMRMCEVEYSLDGGLSFVQVSPNAVRDSLTWTFAATYKDSARQGFMVVYEYQNRVFQTTSTFILVDSLTGITSRENRAAPSSGPRVSIDRRGILRITGAREDPSARIMVFSANGARVLSSRVHNGAVSFASPSRGVLIYRIDARAGRAVR